MNQQVRQPISGISINSKHYIDQLESAIIQIAKCLSVEKALPVDPDTKEMTRQVVQEKLNGLLSDEQLKIVKEAQDHSSYVIKLAKNATSDMERKLAKDIQNLTAVMGLDNV